MRRRSALVLATALATALTTAAAPAAAQTFNFETTPVGTAAPLAVTSGGVTASFTSGANFSVQPSFFGALTGRVLRDDDATISPLTITFSTLLSGISLNFGTNTFAPGTGLTLEARNGATLVGTVNVPAVAPPGFLFPEGVISFGGAAFTSVVLSSAARDFAVDNIAVTQAAVVPEPGTVALVGTGLLLACAVTARRRRAPG